MGGGVVHYYSKNIADFNNATRHLTRLERSLYSDAIELYYDTEKPLTNDLNKLNRLLLAHTQEEKDALIVVLNEFFILTDDGYTNKRCDEEIQAFQAKSNKAKESINKRWNNERNTNVLPTYNEGNTNQEPITNNHKPLNKTHTVEDLTIAEPTLAASVCFSMKEQGLVDINPINPTFLALINAGASREEFIHAASQAKNGGKGFSYAIGIVKKQREEAAKLILHQGAMPTAPPKKQTIHDKRTATAKAMFGGLMNEPEPRVIDVSSYETEAHRALISSSG